MSEAQSAQQPEAPAWRRVPGGVVHRGCAGRVRVREGEAVCLRCGARWAAGETEKEEGERR